MDRPMCSAVIRRGIPRFSVETGNYNSRFRILLRFRDVIHCHDVRARAREREERARERERKHERTRAAREKKKRWQSQARSDTR